MASFERALAITLQFEGFYSTDPDDPGGETFQGISRQHHNLWNGWKEIDQAKSQPSFPENLLHNSELRNSVIRFYREHFWDKLRCDEIADQELANLIFDSAVHLGTFRTTKNLQRALNFQIQKGKPLKVDGAFGAKTLKALTDPIISIHVDRLYETLYILRGAHYLTQINKTPLLKKYLGGWLLRLKSLRAGSQNVNS